MVLRKTALIAGAAALAVSAQTLTERMDDAYERILSKNGIEIGGQINSEYFHSDLSGSATQPKLYSFETTQYTSFDLDMQYRPYDFISARALTRFYQDWQTFFATRSRILAARWLSVDGNLGNMLGFNAGDFRQKYSPLTLWSPELDLVYEPDIFADARRNLMDEQFLGDNNRVLQGLNLNFAKRLDFPVNEVRLDAIASRVRRGEYLDTNGAQGIGYSRSDMDRFFLAANGEAFVKSNVFVGGSYLALLDDRESYRLVSHSAGFDTALSQIGVALPPGHSLNEKDSVVARDLRVTSGRAGVDLAGFLNKPNLTLELMGEYAMSGEANRYAWHFKRDSAGGTPKDVSFEADAPGKDGKAMTLELGAGYQPSDSAFGARLTADYIHNEASFLNPLAQSPTFIPTRVMNTENDIGTGALYSTFDALYDGVYKFSPSRASAVNQQAPYSKLAYNNGVFSPEDLARFNGDAVVQMALPFGLATPNRSGVDARLSGHWANVIHASAEAAVLDALEGEGAAPKRSYSQFAGGVKFELGRLLHRSPLDFSASFSKSESKRDKAAGESASPNVASDLLMVGFHWRFFEKWGLLGGYQQANLTSFFYASERGTGADAAVHPYQYTLDMPQKHFRVGVEYAMTKQAYFLLSGGFIAVETKAANQGTAANAEGPVPARNIDKDFSQVLSQAAIRVKF
jgi:hypothetical protein